MVSNTPFGERTGNQPEQQDTGGRFSQQVQQSGGRLGERLRETGQNIAREQKNRVCEELESVSEVVHEAADRLHERDDHLVADYVDALADQLENAADYIREHSINDLVDRVNDFARRRPEVLIGGALVAGLAAARFLKASRQRQSHESSGMRGSMQGQGSGGGFETRTSEAGPIATPPRTSPHSPGTPSAFGSTGGQSAESGGDVRQAGLGLQDAHGSRKTAEEREGIGGRETPLRDRESQQQQQRPEDKQ